MFWFDGIFFWILIWHKKSLLKYPFHMDNFHFTRNSSVNANAIFLVISLKFTWISYERVNLNISTSEISTFIILLFTLKFLGTKCQNFSAMVLKIQIRKLVCVKIFNFVSLIDLMEQYFRLKYWIFQKIYFLPSFPLPFFK